MLAFLRKQLQDLLEQRAALKTELDGILKTPTEEKRGLNDDEDKVFAEKRDAIKKTDADIEAINTSITDLADSEERDAKAAELRAKYQPAGPQPTGVEVTSEPETDRKRSEERRVGEEGRYRG